MSNGEAEPGYMVFPARAKPSPERHVYLAPNLKLPYGNTCRDKTTTISAHRGAGVKKRYDHRRSSTSHAAPGNWPGYDQSTRRADL